MAKENLKGRLIMSRALSNQEPHEFMSIVLTDAMSGTRVIEARMALDESTRALTSSNGECVFSLWGQKAGMRREVKREKVFVPNGPYNEREARAIAAIKPYEVDGWQGNESGAVNHHNCRKYHDGGADYTVSFIRFVEATQ